MFEASNCSNRHIGDRSQIKIKIQDQIVFYKEIILQLQVPIYILQIQIINVHKRHFD